MVDHEQKMHNKFEEFVIRVKILKTKILSRFGCWSRRTAPIFFNDTIQLLAMGKSDRESFLG
jgi:hypothetical protein